MAKKRAWQPRELRMVAEYLQSHYAKYPYKMRVRLGSIPTELVKPGMSWQEMRMAGVWRRYADAVVIQPRKVVIIEAAIKPDPGDISKLKLYGDLFKHTPEFAPYHSAPVALELVFALEDPVVFKLARKEKIKVVYYKPEWVDEYLATLLPRERRASLGNPDELS